MQELGNTVVRKRNYHREQKRGRQMKDRRNEIFIKGTFPQHKGVGEEERDGVQKIWTGSREKSQAPESSISISKGGAGVRDRGGLGKEMKDVSRESI